MLVNGTLYDLIVASTLLQTPLSHISEDVYKASVDWLNKRSLEALNSFVLWSLDSILADFAAQQASAKGSKKGAQNASSKSQVSVVASLFVCLKFMCTGRDNDTLVCSYWVAQSMCTTDIVRFELNLTPNFSFFQKV